MKNPRSKKSRSDGSLAGCYALTGAVTLVVGLVLFYAYVFTGIKKIKEEAPNSAAGQVITSLETAARGLKTYLTRPARCPTPTDGADADEWLDKVNDNPPPIEPSHYAMVHGIEPFEIPDTKPFHLHAIPTDDWYEKAKRATDRCDLELTEQIQGGENGLADDVVWVSGLFDLKRGEAGNKDFQRSMNEYYHRFQNVLDRGFKMVIFIPHEFEEHLRIDTSRVKIVYMNMTELRDMYFPYYDRLQAIRTSKLWNEQAVMTGWLSNAPQARLPDYNPLVMSKLMLVQHAARLNLWGVRYHMWMDAGHLCAGELNPTPEGTSMYRRHMAEGLFVTHWPYGTTTEVHGMTDRAMHLYLGTAEDPLRIVRGGIFGGTLPYIECVLKAYVLALHQTLTDGYLGTEECIWAMVHARLPHLFKSFDNNSLGNHGDNCASFQASTIEERAIKAGSQQAFKSPAVPKYPSWWEEASRIQRLTEAAAAVATGGTKSGHSLVKIGGIGLRGKTA